MNDDEREAWMVAAGDQLGARFEQVKSEQLEEYLTGPDPDSIAEEPVRLWEEHDVWCAVLRGPIGYLCGYARLPDSHPWIGLHAEDRIPNPVGVDLEQPVEQAMDDNGAVAIFAAALGGEDGFEEYQRSLAAAVPVHGGVTFTGPMPILGAPHGWWIGFDCGHADDAPDEKIWRELHPWATDEQTALLCGDGHVWTAEEVALEVKRMVPPILAARTAKRETQTERKGTQDG